MRGPGPPFPGRALRFELLQGRDAPIQGLATQHTDLDLDHIQPAGVLRDVVELQPAQDPSGFARRECLIESAG